MWISRIELINFKAFQHQDFMFPEPSGGKNIVLVGGMNGYGKTSILEALYLCLYGRDAITHLARAGLKSDESRGYPTFLEKAFNGEALRAGRDSMMIKVTINMTKTKAIDITRKWYFRANGTWAADEEAIVRDIIRGVPGTPNVDGRNDFYLSEHLDQFFVPAHVAPFFFFDGEEVKKLADQSRVEQVKQGLEGLLGVVLLRNLADRLRQFEAKRRSEVATVDEEKLGRLHEVLLENQKELSDLQKTIQTSVDEQIHLKGQLRSLIERVTAAGGGGGDIATVKELVEEREQLRTKLRESHNKFESLLSGILPFYLVDKELFAQFRRQIERERRFFAWETDKKSLEPRKLEFEFAFFDQTEPPVIPALTPAQDAAIKLRIESAWASLFYPPPDDCAKEIVHDYLNEHDRAEISKYLATVSRATGNS
jgi:DNA sulfur modification protein DndD